MIVFLKVVDCSLEYYVVTSYEVAAYAARFAHVMMLRAL